MDWILGVDTVVSPHMLFNNGSHLARLGSSSDLLIYWSCSQAFSELMVILPATMLCVLYCRG
jgi:hypothetical protein